MFDDKLVSIVTPAYRASRFVVDTIRSVQAQSHTYWEMLIVDDCSPDDTCAVVEKECERDSRVRLIRQPKNGGPAAARNAGLAQAKGRWIAFVDSDDLWMPEKLARQLAFHRSVQAKLTFTEFRRISEKGDQIGRLITVPDRLTYRQLLGNTAIATSTVIVDRALTGNFIMKKTYYDDFACWLEILRSGGYASGLHEDLMRYRVVGQSVSRNKRKSAREVWNTYRLVERLNPFASAWYFTQYATRGLLKYRNF